MTTFDQGSDMTEPRRIQHPSQQGVATVDVNQPTPNDKTPKWLIVTQRELMVKLKDKSFWISTLVTLLIIAASFAIPFLMNSGDTKVAVGNDQAETVVNAAKDVAEQNPTMSGWVVERVADQAAAEQAVRDGDAKAALVLGDDGGWTLVGKDSVSSQIIASVTQVLGMQTMGELAAQAGVSPDELAAKSTVTTKLLDDEESSDSERQGIAMFLGVIFGVLFLMSSMTYGMQIAQSVVEEKQSRIVEILVSLVPVRQVLTGKVVGNTIIAVAQTALLVLVALIGVQFTPLKELLQNLTASVLWFIVFFVAGFLALACIWAAAGALCTRNEDLQHTSTPLMIIVMGAYIAGFSATGTARVVLSFVPIVSSVLMPVRIFEGTAAWWEVALSLVITIIFAAFMVLLGERIYRRALLQTHGRLTFRQAMKLPEDTAVH